MVVMHYGYFIIPIKNDSNVGYLSNGVRNHPNGRLNLLATTLCNGLSTISLFVNLCRFSWGWKTITTTMLDLYMHV